MCAHISRFFPLEQDPANEQFARTFSRRIPEFEISMAQLQGHMLRYSESPGECVEALAELMKSRNPTPETRITVWEHLRRVGLEHWAAFLG